MISASNPFVSFQFAFYSIIFFLFRPLTFNTYIVSMLSSYFALGLELD